MKRLFLSTILIFLVFSLPADSIEDQIALLSEKVAASFRTLPNAKYRNTIAVLDFVNATPLAEEYDLGFVFSEIISTHLSSFRKEFRVTERKQLDSILEEQKMQLTGLTEGEPVRIGQILGADLLLVGSVFEAAELIRVDVRLVETEGSEILLSESVSLPREVFIRRAEDYLVMSHSIALGYQTVFCNDFLFHRPVITYRYNFPEDFFLGIDFAYAITPAQDRRVNEGDSAGLIFYDIITLHPAVISTGLQIGKQFSPGRRFSLSAYIGPSFAAYLDTTILREHYENNTSYNTGDSTINPVYIFIGASAGMQGEFRLARKWTTMLGAGYTYYPDQKDRKTIDWEDAGIPTSGTVTVADTLSPAGGFITAGLSYRF